MACVSLFRREGTALTGQQAPGGACCPERRTHTVTDCILMTGCIQLQGSWMGHARLTEHGQGQVRWHVMASSAERGHLAA